MSEKLQKIMARAGLASRREAERWIQDGRVRLNRRQARLGDRASADDRVEVDGMRLEWPCIESQLLMYHKPEGLICTHDDPEGRETIFSQLPSCEQGRWITIGRLDINSSGLLLISNDGDWANRLMHPSHHIDREYLVRASAPLSEDERLQLQRGIRLEDGMAQFKSIRLQEKSGSGRNTWYTVVITQGRNRIVRRMFEAMDCQVSRLMRTRIGALRLPKDLAPGRCRSVTIQQVLA